MSPPIRSAQEFVLIVYSRKDEIANRALKVLSEYEDGSLTDFGILDVEESDGEWVDPRVKIVVFRLGKKQEVQTTLFEWLANNKPSLQVIRIVGLLASDTPEGLADPIDKNLRLLRQAIVELAIFVRVLEFRLAAPSVGAPMQKEPFFAHGITANLISIPRDSTAHDAVARPIQASDSETYSAHVAVEVATLFGLWREVENPIVDEINSLNPGVPEIIVYFVSARVGLINCPPLPIGALISNDGELPAPFQYIALPDSTSTISRTAMHLFPSSLKFVAMDLPGTHVLKVTSSEFIRRYFREFLAAIVTIPRILIKGFQSEVNGLAGMALQEAVGGANSAIEVVYPGRAVGGDIPPISKEYIQATIAKVSDRADRPMLSAIPESTWVDLVEQVLGVADGSSEASGMRRAIADEKYLVLSQEVLAPAQNGLADVLDEIFYGGVVDGSGTEVELDSTAAPDSGEPVPDLGIVAATSFIDEFESSVSLETVATDQVSEPTNEVIEPIPAVRPRNNILSAISGLITDESQIARSRAAEMVTRLRELPDMFQGRDVEGISKAVRVSIGIGLSVLYFAIGVFTDRRIWFSFELLSPTDRDLAWVLVSTAIFSAAICGLFLKANDRWQSRLITISTGVVMLLVAEFIFIDSLRSFFLKLSVVRGSPLISAILLGIAVLTVAVSYRKNIVADSRLRNKFAILLFVLTWCYALIGITAYFGSSRSSLRELSEKAEFRLQLLSFIFGGVLILVSASVVAFSILRERYRLEQVSRLLNWTVSELEVSSDAAKRLAIASTQWVGTAAVLARLFHYPLGEAIAHAQEVSLDGRPKVSALKFNEEVLILSRRGEQGLSARLRNLFVSRGWLGRQYFQLISRYRDDIALSQGLTREQTKGFRPESCPSSPSFENILANKARGARWSFLASVYKGEYDDSLLSLTGEVPLEEAYSTIIEDETSHRVGATGMVAPNFFSRLIPSDVVLLPGGLVRVLFTANDVRQFMNAHIWWPEEFLATPSSANVKSFHKSKVLTPDRLTNWIRMLGACVLVSHPFRLDDVGQVVEKPQDPVTPGSGNGDRFV